MRSRLVHLFCLTAVLVCMPLDLAHAANGFRGGHGRGHGFGHRHGLGFGIGGVYDYGWDLAELYRELLNNVPYYALHPPVYYSYPVPRTYGYSPFAYPPYVTTPEVVEETKAVEILNPYVPQQKPADQQTDRAASTSAQPQPLVIVNPFVAPNRSVAQQ